ncbi:unnamed protein product [Larinioides sclopetarius]|uniref:Sushi domain-containing protein n=1 Tax=Larinioides sclopetarius TaxID=280406 RepID=A0AAV2A057_9ARAC
MLTAAFFFAITLTSPVITSTSDSLFRCISCPCGLLNQNYTQCDIETLLRDFTCERWSHCQTCKANTTFCITCRLGHFGPTCSESSDEHTRRKRQKYSNVLNHSRYPRQSGSGRHSETRCLNHGIISNGRLIVILSFESRKTSEDDDDFDFPYGTRLKYTCDDGFSLVGKGTSRCGSDGFWTESIPECVGETPTYHESCKHPGVDVNGRINGPRVDPRRRRQGFSAGTELTFGCNDGFEPEGATVLACLSNGQWTSLPPKCRRSPTSEVVELPCRHPGVVINGMFNGELYKSSFPVGTAVTFRCIEGTQRKGPMTIFCRRNGMWSESPPSCKPTRNSK